MGAQVKKGELSWEEFLRFKAANSVYRFIIVTGSMAPLIPVGSFVVVDAGASLKKGDIIVFWQDSKLVCHILWHENRLLLDHGEKLYATRSLKSAHFDITIRQSQILGGVLSHKLPWYWKLRLGWHDFKRARRT